MEKPSTKEACDLNIGWDKELPNQLAKNKDKESRRTNPSPSMYWYL